jgi:hypothetical protein
MANIDNDKLLEFKNSIIQEVLKEVKYYIDNSTIEKTNTGIVKSVSVDNSTATIDIDFMTTDMLPNKTGETLAIGDKVKIFSDTKTLVDAYIGVLLSKYIP